MKKQVIERVLAFILSVVVILSSTSVYTVYATQENTAGTVSVTESTTAAEDVVTDTTETPTEDEAVVYLVEGDGTKENPYKIAKPSDFAVMQGIINDTALVEKNFVLTADIDFGDVKVTPIENFTGSFNGNGHVIKNLIVDVEKGSAGLFATIAGSEEKVAEFKNITFKDVKVKGADGVGALAGIANAYTLIDNCHVTGSVSGATVGGLVGYIAGGTVSNSSANVTVEGKNIAGGLVGMSEAVIKDCETFGEVNAEIADAPLAGVGGVVGVMKAGEIRTSSSLADVTVTAVANSSTDNGIAGVGGFAGVAQGTVIEKSFSAGVVKVSGAQAVDVNSVVGIGGFAGISMVKVKSIYSSSAVSADFNGKADGNALRAIGGLIGVAFDDASDSYASGGVIATLNGVKINDRDCYAGGVIGFASGENYKNLYFDKSMNNDNALKAVSNIADEDVIGLTTAEFAEGAKLSSAFSKTKDAYPYLKDLDKNLSTVLSIVTTTASADDKSASLGVGASKAVTLPTEIKLGDKAYKLSWKATDSAVLEGNTANLKRTKACADYMTLTVSVDGVSKTYSRLYTDVGSFEANVGNTAVEYKLVNNSGDEYMNTALVGLLIKSNLEGGSVVTTDVFTKASNKPSKINNLIVTSDGFYVNSSVPSGYKLEITAKDSAGKALDVTDMAGQGFFVKKGSDNFVSLEISIVKIDTPWGLVSVWESIVR